MIPKSGTLLTSEVTVSTHPGRTYAMQLDFKTVMGHTDELDAVRQAVYKVLNTERYRYIIYSYNYGVELADLYGEPVSYVCPEAERRITEALLCDDRITDVTDFHFNLEQKRSILVTFTVQTIYGNTEIRKAVNY